MTDTNAHARMWARTHDLFAEQDAARREQLDRWIRKSRDPNHDPTGGLCCRGHPLDGVKANSDGRFSRYCRTCNRERMRETNRAEKSEFLCLICGVSNLARWNKTGICRGCISGTGPKTQAHYRAIHEARKGTVTP